MVLRSVSGCMQIKYGTLGIPLEMDDLGIARPKTYSLGDASLSVNHSLGGTSPSVSHSFNEVSLSVAVDDAGRVPDNRFRQS